MSSLSDASVPEGSDDQLPEAERDDWVPEHDPREDSEVDYIDDELPEDQLPLDEVEAREVGANLDDPER